MISFVYQYAVGGVVFFGGLALAWRAGMLGPPGRRGRRAVLLIAGFLFFVALQGALLQLA